MSTATPSAFIEIDDGYTLSGRVKEKPGIHPEVTFAYRPASWSERIECQNLILEPKKQEEYADKLLAAKIKGWCFDGVPVTLENVRRLRTAIKSRLLDIILEYVASDEAEADLKN